MIPDHDRLCVPLPPDHHDPLALPCPMDVDRRRGRRHRSLAAGWTLEATPLGRVREPQSC
jgi:hypothetical protein